LLAALLHQIPRDVLKRLHLVVRPDTVLRWHRDVVARRHAQRSRPRHPGRPRTAHSVRILVLRLVRENPGWGYRRVHGELLVLGIKVAASTVWEILHDVGIDPAPERSSTTWADFLRSQAEGLLACDFFETAPCPGRGCTFFVIEVGTRHVHVLGVTSFPDGAWTVQQARNLLMDLGERAAGFRFLVRDRAGQFTEAFDAVLAAARIEVVKIPRSPAANAFAERWARTARSEVTDRMLIAGPRDPRAVLEEYVAHYNRHRPHRGRNLRPPDSADSITVPVTDLATARIRRHKVFGGLIHEYERAA
jgi:transposase